MRPRTRVRRRSIMDVRIAGLAVAGDCGCGDGSTVLASWSAFDRAGDWFVEMFTSAGRGSGKMQQPWATPTTTWSSSTRPTAGCRARLRRGPETVPDLAGKSGMPALLYRGVDLGDANQETLRRLPAAGASAIVASRLNSTTTRERSAPAQPAVGRHHSRDRRGAVAEIDFACHAGGAR